MAGTDEPRPAATVIVVRDRADGALETLMVLRNLKSDFVGGAYVFPGGAVDASDADGALIARCVGIDDEGASVTLGVEAGGLASYVACARELFEEAGLLLASRLDGEPIDASDVDVVRRLSDHRRGLNDGTVSMLDLLEAEGLVLDLGALHYFAHWITPVGPPRRYDTRFFVASAPRGQVPLHDDRELVGHVWVTPDEALERHRAGEMQLILPTIKNLEAIARFATTSDLLEVVSRPRDVPRIEPKIIAEGNGVRILLPGDEGFDDAVVGEGVITANRSIGNDDIARASTDVQGR
jgi:8-oxo-dGTP pyrophosphatase MutT (NUDIX family)